MAKLKGLKVKSKTFIFKSFGNDKDAVPGKIIFGRFPTGYQTFLSVEKKDVFKDIDLEKLRDNPDIEALKEKLTDNILNSFRSNMNSGTIDFKAFFEECIDGFEDFEYEDLKITTLDDFWGNLPYDAAETIATEAYNYAMKRDEFTVGE